jgi:putative membrane protein
MPRWHAHPDVWLLIATLGIGYAWAVRRIGPKIVHPVERAVTRKQVTLFAVGLATMWLAADWPIHDLAERSLYSVHMFQHVLLSLIAAPLLLVGTPDWLLRRLLQPPGFVRIARFVTRPFMGLVLFNTMIVVTHIPNVVDASVHSELTHFGLHAGLFVTALCMWSPVLNPLIELPKLSYPGRMVYLFLQSLVPTVPASFLTFGSTVLYKHYASVPRVAGISALTDQRIAGLFMKIGGGAIIWSVIAWYFFKWYATEERENVDVLEWSKLDTELNKVELKSR